MAFIFYPEQSVKKYDWSMNACLLLMAERQDHYTSYIKDMLKYRGSL
jgi:hypothetical protein